MWCIYVYLWFHHVSPVSPGKTSIHSNQPAISIGIPGRSLTALRSCLVGSPVVATAAPARRTAGAWDMTMTNPWQLGTVGNNPSSEDAEDIMITIVVVSL